MISLGIEDGGVMFSAIVTFPRCFDAGESCHFFIIGHQNHPVYLPFLLSLFDKFVTAVIKCVDFVDLQKRQRTASAADMCGVYYHYEVPQKLVNIAKMRSVPYRYLLQ